MKIAHIVCAYPPYYSGMGTVVFEMVQALTKLGHDGRSLPRSITQRKRFGRNLFRRGQRMKMWSRKKSAVRRLAPSLQYGNAARIPQLKSELDF